MICFLVVALSNQPKMGNYPQRTPHQFESLASAETASHRLLRPPIVEPSDRFRQKLRPRRGPVVNQFSFFFLLGILRFWCSFCSCFGF